MRDFDGGGMAMGVGQVPTQSYEQPMKAVADEADAMMGMLEEELSVLRDREHSLRTELEIVETLRDGAHARLIAMRERRSTAKIDRTANVG
jgi:hypothetical protein